LPLHISDHVVNPGHRDIKLSLDQVRELENRVKSVGEADFNPAAREVAFVLCDPDWPIESAWEDNDRNWLKALLSTNSAYTDSSNNRRRSDSECRRYKALTQFLLLSGYRELACRISHLEFDADFHHLRAGNLEIGAGPLRVVMHEGE
jgi:hypothetical protein